MKAGTAPQVHQTGYLVTRKNKVAALARILDMNTPKSTLVFCRTRLEVDELISTLNGRGFKSEGLHGGLNQAQRDRVMASFRSGKTDLLVATDVAARGLDISHVSHVMNYDVPCGHHLQDPVDIHIVKEPVKPGVAPRVHQTGYLVNRKHKVSALVRILDMNTPKSTLVFCRTRLEVDELISTLNGRGYRSEGLHGGLNQAQRDRVMGSFRSGKTDLLVATDVAARGLDISHIC